LLAFICPQYSVQRSKASNYVAFLVTNLLKRHMKFSIRVRHRQFKSIISHSCRPLYVMVP